MHTSLDDVLPRKQVRGTIGFGSMNDPYMPIERKYKLTRRALEVVARNQFPVHIITKSDLVLRDIDFLEKINQIYAAVSFTITTADDDLARKLEPGAAPSSDRFKAMKTLSDAGILTGVTMQPILPFIEDTPGNITRIVELAHQNGASYILPWFGMSLREGSRDYYYDKLDQLFPGIKKKYVQRYGSQYICNAPNWHELDELFQKAVYKYGIATKMPVFTPEPVKKSNQLRLL
ncbi:MAG: radical SAM protein [Anaerolineales bacterium]|nr:radical SAM protein [Anaerolineales bacterium]